MGLLKAGSRSAEAPAHMVTTASLADPAPGLRRQAVQALVGDPGDPARLADLLHVEADASVRQAAFLALAAIGTRTAAEAAAGKSMRMVHLRKVRRQTRPPRAGVPADQ